MSPATPRLKGIRYPLIALMLGLLPFWLFVGTSQTKTYNGTLIESSRFNVLGCVFGLIGLVMAVKVIFKRGPSDQYRWPATAVSALAVIVCLVQLGDASELFKIDDIKRFATRTIGWPALPVARIKGPDAAAETDIRDMADHLDQDRLRMSIANTLAFLNGATVRRNAYSARCYTELDKGELAPLPPYLTPADQKLTGDYIDAMGQRPVPACSAAGTEENISDLGDEIAEHAAELKILQDTYDRRFGAHSTPTSDASNTQAPQ